MDFRLLLLLVLSLSLPLSDCLGLGVTKMSDLVLVRPIFLLLLLATTYSLLCSGSNGRELRCGEEETQV